MMKAFLYSFVLATVTLAVQPAKRDDVNYEANKKSLQACYKDCKQYSFAEVHACNKACDQKFPVASSYGCHKNYCWSNCKATNIGQEWCYTTKSSSQSYQYVQCTADSECNKDWSCGGPCAAF